MLLQGKLEFSGFIRWYFRPFRQFKVAFDTQVYLLNSNLHYSWKFLRWKLESSGGSFPPPLQLMAKSVCY
jgi:hypothetical protein